MLENKWNEKYPVESALEKFFNQLTISIRRLTYYFTHVPKKKEVRMVYVLQMILAFILIDSGLVLLITLLKRW